MLPYTSMGRARAGLAVVVLGLLVVLGGCGGSGSASGSKAEEGKTPTQVFADAKSALFNAKAVHATGTVTSSGGGVQIDVQLQDQDTAGSVTVAGQKVQIVKTGGTIYLKAPAGFWTKTAGPQGAALAGKWIKVDAAQAGGLSQLTLQGLAANLSTSDSPLTGATMKSTANGRKALLLTQKDGSQLFVADSATPVPLKAVTHGASQGTITFSGYGKTQAITAPPGAVTPQQALGSAKSTT